MKITIKNKKLMLFIYILGTVVFMSLFSLSLAMIENKSNTVKNDFYGDAYINVEINEPNGQEYLIKNDGTLQSVSDSSKSKVVNFKNSNDTSPQYVRARIVPVVTLKDKKTEVQVEVKISELINISNKWNEGEDGYYYYRTPILPGEYTENLFENIVISAPSFQELKDNNWIIKLNIIVDTVRTDTSGNIALAKSAWHVDPITGKKINI